MIRHLLLISLSAAALAVTSSSAAAQPMGDEPGIVRPGDTTRTPASAPASAPVSRPTAAGAPPPAAAVDGLEALVQRLQRASDPRARHAAARRLGRLGDQRAGPALAWALQRDPAPPVRAAAAVALGQLRVNAAAPHLQAAAVHDRADEVRFAALAALEQLGIGSDRKAQEHLLLVKDETYVSGRRFRGAGIGVLAGGVGGGLLFGAFGLGAAGASCGDVGCGDPEAAVTLWIIGAVLATAGLAAGIPMIVVGQGRINSARKRAGLAGLLRRRDPLVTLNRAPMLRYGWTF